jgi:hypothetical protein
MLEFDAEARTKTQVERGRGVGPGEIARHALATAADRGRDDIPVGFKADARQRKVAHAVSERPSVDRQRLIGAVEQLDPSA